MGRALLARRNERNPLQSDNKPTEPFRGTDTRPPSKCRFFDISLNTDGALWRPLFFPFYPNNLLPLNCPRATDTPRRQNVTFL